MTHDALMPRPADGIAPGAALSLLVHAALLGALILSVDWRMRAPETVSAELWSSIPQVAAPPAATPAPPPPAPAPAPGPTPAPPPPKEAAPAPPPPDIAVERAEKRRLEKEHKAEEARKAEAAKKAAAEEARREAAQAKAEEARLAKARDEQMKRIFGALPGSGPATGTTGTAAQDGAPSQAYIGRLIASLRNSVRFPDNLPGNPTVEVRLRATATGTILSRVVTKKSGVDEFDAAVLRGIDRLGTLPRDTDGRVPQDLLITFRLKE